MTTFVSVGNAKQSFKRLLVSVLNMAQTLPQPVVVQYGYSVFSSPLCHCTQFMSMEEFGDQIKNASLLILHAGAGSIIHACHAGKIPVVMPRRMALSEHIDDHQVELAQALARSGKVVVAMKPEDMSYAVERAIALQKNSVEKRSENLLVSLISRTLEKSRRYRGGV